MIKLTINTAPMWIYILQRWNQFKFKRMPGHCWGDFVWLKLWNLHKAWLLNLQLQLFVFLLEPLWLSEIPWFWCFFISAGSDKQWFPYLNATFSSFWVYVLIELFYQKLIHQIVLQMHCHPFYLWMNHLQTLMIALGSVFRLPVVGDSFDILAITLMTMTMHWFKDSNIISSRDAWHCMIACIRRK